jgi:hypothetical protein
MRRYGELSKDQEPSLPHQFCSDCIITTRGYDFREGQIDPQSSVAIGRRIASSSRQNSMSRLRKGLPSEQSVHCARGWVTIPAGCDPIGDDVIGLGSAGLPDQSQEAKRCCILRLKSQAR